MPQSNVSKSGLVLSPDGSGYAVDWAELPSSDHFFLATDCHVKESAAGINLLFGATSSFDENSEHYDLAVEIHFPIQEAKQYLHRSVFVELSGNGKKTYYESIKDSLEKMKVNTTGTSPAKLRKLPVNRNAAFRIFPANFATMSFAGTQALIEFFEVTPELIHFVTSRTKMRPFAGVKPVVSVILDTFVMYNFMNSCKAVMDGMPSGDDL